MTISEQLLADMKAAMKAHDSDKLATIRFLRSTIQNAEIDGASDDDASVQKIIASQVKKSKEAVAEFQAAGRDDLAESEQAKITVMEGYLPAQLSDEQLQAVVTQVVQAAGSGANVGQLIGQVVKQVAGQADGGRVKAMVEQVLTQGK